MSNFNESVDMHSMSDLSDVSGDVVSIDTSVLKDSVQPTMARAMARAMVPVKVPSKAAIAAQVRQRMEAEAEAEAEALPMHDDDDDDDEHDVDDDHGGDDGHGGDVRMDESHDMTESANELKREIVCVKQEPGVPDLSGFIPIKVILTYLKNAKLLRIRQSGKELYGMDSLPVKDAVDFLTYVYSDPVVATLELWDLCVRRQCFTLVVKLDIVFELIDRKFGVAIPYRKCYQFASVFGIGLTEDQCCEFIFNITVMTRDIAAVATAVAAPVAATAAPKKGGKRRADCGTCDMCAKASPTTPVTSVRFLANLGVTGDALCTASDILDDLLSKSAADMKSEIYDKLVYGNMYDGNGITLISVTRLTSYLYHTMNFKGNNDPNFVKFKRELMEVGDYDSVLLNTLAYDGTCLSNDAATQLALSEVCMTYKEVEFVNDIVKIPRGGSSDRVWMDIAATFGVTKPLFGVLKKSVYATRGISGLQKINDELKAYCAHLQAVGDDVVEVPKMSKYQTKCISPYLKWLALMTYNRLNDLGNFAELCDLSLYTPPQKKVRRAKRVDDVVSAELGGEIMSGVVHNVSARGGTDSVDDYERGGDEGRGMSDVEHNDDDEDEMSQPPPPPPTKPTSKRCRTWEVVVDDKDGKSKKKHIIEEPAYLDQTVVSAGTIVRWEQQQQQNQI